MKAKELMIGDWIEEKVVGKRQWQLYDFKDYDDNWEKWISPIPLTGEILEKNGFEIQELRWWYSIYNSKYKNYTIVAYYDKDDGDVAIPFRGHWVYDANYAFDYVHELQHALRLCGLSELADNLVL